MDSDLPTNVTSLLSVDSLTVAFPPVQVTCGNTDIAQEEEEIASHVAVPLTLFRRERSKYCRVTE